MAKTINFTDYDALGFDMDFTLARYELVPFFDMVYEGVSRFLVEEKNYDASIFHDIHEDKDLIYKGLIADFERGNVLKLGHDGIILRATHGTKKLTEEDIIKAYGPDKKFAEYEAFKNGMKSLDGKWRFFENYFDIPGMVAFARIIDNIRKTGSKEEQATYEHIWADVLSALEELYIPSHYASNRSKFFTNMKKSMEKYIDHLSPQMKEWLRTLRQNKRQVFLLTSSYPDFACLVMEFILGSEWRSYFDIIIFGGRKPKFFTETRPFVVIKNTQFHEEVRTIKAGGEYCFGNNADLMAYFRKSCGKQDPKVIYFGDNLWADAWPSKTLAGWDSVLVLEEMDAEGYAVSDGTVPGHEDEIEDPDKPAAKQRRKYEHSSLVTAEEIEIMVSEFWGSIFIDETGISGETAGGDKRMNTAFADLISQYADICVPSIEYLAGVPVDHVFTAFAPEAGNSRGFHPGRPRSLLL